MAGDLMSLSQARTPLLRTVLIAMENIHGRLHDLELLEEILGLVEQELVVDEPFHFLC